MEIDTKNNPVIRNFIGPAKNMDGKNFTVNVMVFNGPIADTKSHGPIHTGAFIDNDFGETVYSVFFSSQFSDEEVQKQADLMISNIDDHLKPKITKK